MIASGVEVSERERARETVDGGGIHAHAHTHTRKGGELGGYGSGEVGTKGVNSSDRGRELKLQ